MLAVLLAVKKWSAYLLGRHFRIKTDHQSLRFLTNQQAITPSQQKWVVKMMGFDYEVCYRKGIHNKVADVLSRNPLFAECTPLTVSASTTDTLDKIVESWKCDDKLQKLIAELEQGNGLQGKYSWDGQRLRRKGKLMVGKDDGLRSEILKFFHGSPMGGHSGVHASTKRTTAVVY
ncbi:hypothetical protein HRI_000078700 [Hibiscus trionum]|uniref:Reverse transcriptase RNase H-like domain-containing protein n=1 Tax=Hibiscus trionum TaxID=183268 RepID=A0A9W7GSI3_HIBTR|nr:hypothetical protein HRI_000078700 [Hibiscus trionum]